MAGDAFFKQVYIIILAQASPPQRSQESSDLQRPLGSDIIEVCLCIYLYKKVVLRV